MRCHYEVLEVPKDADDGQIKTAYRKLALKLHPDKNLDNAELAKEQFQLVQQAYEVLGDRQERAWYDNHREQILRGKNSNFTDNSLDVFQYFTTTCFEGYNDEKNGFYTVYRKVFEEIAREDIEHMEEKEEFTEIPGFGSSKSDYEETVGPFYAFWSSYNTKKSFVWLDPYSSSETRDRKILKLMEKENKKVRQKAKKERNEEIRALVAFARKRDKRVEQYTKKLEAKILENRQKQEELSKQRRLERKKQIETKSQAEWTKFDNVKDELEEIEKQLAQQFGEEISDSEDEQLLELDNLYCIACNKLFKTQKAFQNHESSKKHKENVEHLKVTMAEEEEDFIDSDELDNEDGENEEIDVDAVAENSEVDVNDESQLEECGKKKKQKKKRNVLAINVSDEDLPISETTEEAEHTTPSTTTKTKRRSKKTNKVDKNLNTSDQDAQAEESAREKVSPQKLRKNKKQKSEQSDVDTSHCCVTCQADFASKNKLFDHLKKTGHSVYLPQNTKVKGKKQLKRSNVNYV